MPKRVKIMETWFTLNAIDEDTFIISEYRHWEETHSYLLNGKNASLLIDTGLGICNIYEEVVELTDKPVIAVATHVHWDHIGGHRYFKNFYVHEAEASWLNGGFPQTLETIKSFVTERCQLPSGFDIDSYEIFQGVPTKILSGGEKIDIGQRTIEVVHTPGHSPGHMCFWEPGRRYLFTGDLVYKDMLTAWFPTTDPIAYLSSLEKIAKLPAERVFPAHHSLNIEPEIIARMRDEFRRLQTAGQLKHGGGVFDFGDWSLKI